MVAGRHGALQVDLDDGIPLLLGHREDHPIPEDACVVDEHVEAAEGLEGLVHQAFGTVPRADVVGVGHRLAALGLDLGHHLVGRSGIRAGAVTVAAQVVHDDLGAVAGQRQCVLAAQSPPTARHDADSSLAHALGHP